MSETTFHQRFGCAGLTSYAVRTPEQRRAIALRKARIQAIALKSLRSPKQLPKAVA